METTRNFTVLLGEIMRHDKASLFEWKTKKTNMRLSSKEFVSCVYQFDDYLNLIMADKFGHRLEKRGKVAFMIYNGPEWHVVRMGCAMRGVVSIPILTEVSDHDLAVILTKSDPSLVIVKTESHKQKVRRVLASLDKNIPVKIFSITPDEPNEITVDFRIQKTLLFDRHPVFKNHELAMLFFTSGTTSDPKGVMHSQKSLLANVDACSRIFPVSDGDVVLSFLPVSHIFQQAVDTLALLRGATIVCAEPNPELIMEAFQEFKPTCAAASPVFFEKFLKKFAFRLEKELKKKSTLLRTFMRVMLKRPFIYMMRNKLRNRVFGPNMKFFVSGGAPLSKETASFIQDTFGVPIYQGWGMTEVAGAGTCNTPYANVPGSCGRPIPETEIAIAREFGSNSYIQVAHSTHVDEHVPFYNKVGEVLIKGPAVMLEYYKDPEATAEKFIEKGYMRTGDLGYIDQKGFLWIEGRADDTIVFGSGLKVNAGALEERIKQGCPFVDQVVVLPDKNKNGLVALVYPDEEALVNIFPKRNPEGEWIIPVMNGVASQIHELNLPRHERPRVVLLKEPLSTTDETLTPTLKPRRRVIREKYSELLN